MEIKSSESRSLHQQTSLAQDEMTLVVARCPPFRLMEDKGENLLCVRSLICLLPGQFYKCLWSSLRQQKPAFMQHSGRSSVLTFKTVCDSHNGCVKCALSPLFSNCTSKKFLRCDHTWETACLGSRLLDVFLPSQISVVIPSLFSGIEIAEEKSESSLLYSFRGGLLFYNVRCFQHALSLHWIISLIWPEVNLFLFIVTRVYWFQRHISSIQGSYC